MSIIVCRHYIFPIERLRDAFEAATELHSRSKKPFTNPVLLPDGALVNVPFAYDDILDAEEVQPPYILKPGDGLNFEYMLRVFIDEELAGYLNPEDEDYFVRRLKGGGQRAIFPLDLNVRVEPPYAEFVFSNRTTQLAFVIDSPPTVAVLDHIGRQAEGLVTYEENPDGSFVVYPLKAKLPRRDEGEMDMESIIRFVGQPLT